MRPNGSFTIFSMLLITATSLAGPLTIQAQTRASLVVDSPADSGPGSLREALGWAASGEALTFDPAVFPPGQPVRIVLTSDPLPSIQVGDLTIDASEAGVILDGSQLPEGNGLVIQSDGNQVKGLWILGFPDAGILISGAAHNLVGGTNPTPGGACSGDCNLVSGNHIGIQISGQGSFDNTVSGNYLGTDLTGETGMGIQVQGIEIKDGAHDNLIGGETQGQGNLISGNASTGITILGEGTTNNRVLGNRIGLYQGEARQAFPTDLAISPNYAQDCTLYASTHSSGIHKSSDCGETWAEANNGLEESAFRQVEIPSDAADGNWLFALSARGHLYESTDGAATWNLVSAALEGYGVRNLVLSVAFSRNGTMFLSTESLGEEMGGGPGVFKSIDGGLTFDRIVQGMQGQPVLKVVASTDPAAKDLLLALTQGGIEISMDAGAGWTALPSPGPDLVDLAISPTYSRDQTLVASSKTGRLYLSSDGGATWSGMEAAGPDPRYLTFSPYYAVDRTLCYFLMEWGERIYCSQDGGNTWAERDPDLVGHLENQENRITFSPNYPSDGTIFTISIAGMSRSTDGGASWENLKGFRDLGNVTGVALQEGASQNTIGPGNLISNNHNGIAIRGADSHDNLVIGNLVGLDPGGTYAQGNSCEGVSIYAGNHNWIGDGTQEGRNTISGNRCAGVWLGFPETVANTITGNYIGTDAQGRTALGNGGESGLVILQAAHDNLIGGETADQGNLISGNEREGVAIFGSDTLGNTVMGNTIGTDASGKEPLGNQGNGVLVSMGAGSNLIGPGNLIAFNANGVKVEGQGTIGNRITQNSIRDNLEAGIQIGSGGNLEIPAPEFSLASTRVVRGTATPGARVEIFSDKGGQGSAFLDSAIANPEGVFVYRPPTGRFPDLNLTATATDPEGNTSNFSSPASPPAPVVARELPGILAPNQVSVEPTVVGTNLGLAIFSVLFFGFTSTIFNQILEDYRNELVAGLNRMVPRRLAVSLRKVDRSLDGLTRKGRGRLVLIWVSVVLVTALIESFLDPEMGAFATERLGVVITLFLGGLWVSSLEAGSDWYAHRRWIPKTRTESKVQWMGIFIAVGCVVLSRSLGFKPGYLYGIVGAIYLIPRLTDRTHSGKRALFVLLSIFLGGLLFWIATAFLPEALVELEAVFLTIFLISLQGVFFELFPLSITDGGDIASWKRWVWVVFFSVVFFCFYHFQLNPNASAVQALQQNGVQTLIILIGVFGLATFALWLLLPYRLGRLKTG
jgi:hypothetical protein